MNDSRMKRPGFRPGWLALCILFALATHDARTAEWRLYNGPNGNRTSDEVIGTIAWPTGGPTPRWKVATDKGFSSFTIAAGKAFTLVSRTDTSSVKREVCVALNAATGQELWAAWMGQASYDSGGNSGASGNAGGDGPRSTPACDGQRVYVLDARLNLYCFNAANGSELWQKDIVANYAGRPISWQNAASPLLEGELVIVGGGGAGQSLLAFDRTDGHLVWKSLDELNTHATPVQATIQGIRQIIFFTRSGLVAVAVTNGALLWRYAFPFSTATGASPVVSGDTVYCSAGYGVGAAVCQIVKNGTQLESRQLWRKPGDLMNQWSTPVCHNGYIYGLFGHASYGVASLKCVELATGIEKWSRPNFGQGNLMLARDKVIVLSDAGDIVVVEATPAAYTEVARAKMLTGKCWSSPVLSDNRIYARSTVEGVCFDFSTIVRTGVNQFMLYDR